MTIGEMLDMATDYTETTVNGDIDESVFDKPQPPAPPAAAAPADAAPADAAPADAAPADATPADATPASQPSDG